MAFVPWGSVWVVGVAFARLKAQTFSRGPAFVFDSSRSRERWEVAMAWRGRTQERPGVTREGAKLGGYILEVQRY